MGVAADGPRWNCPRAKRHGDRPQSRRCAGICEENAKNAACRDRTCAPASKGHHMMIQFEKLKAACSPIPRSRLSMMRSRRSSRLPPNCSGLACVQASPRPNSQPGWAPANPPSPGLKTVTRFRVPRRCCAMPRQQAAGSRCGCRPHDAPFAPMRACA